MRIAGKGASLTETSLYEAMDEIGMDEESRKDMEGVLETLRSGEASASVVMRSGKRLHAVLVPRHA